ncbi:MAG TPA: hypothetical protein VMW15_15730 [Terracidiphilus sp.]|nr:hypothetical protein [Terracidiphilus sp.]
MENQLGATGNNLVNQQAEASRPAWVDAAFLLIWLAAAAGTFIPFALDTSPWNALTFNVPGDQGNWWHFLVALPFFLAYPMIWLRLRSLLSAQPLGAAGRRFLWTAAGVSSLGTLLVETPFLLHLAGTTEWQRLAVLSLGLGIAVVSAAVLLLQRHHMAPAKAYLAALDAAYLCNAALCLVVYSGEPGDLWSKSGWFVTSVIFWPIAFELTWIFIQTFRNRRDQNTPRAA